MFCLMKGLEEKKYIFNRELDKEGIYYSGITFTSCMTSGVTSLQEVCMWRISMMDRPCPDL